MQVVVRGGAESNHPGEMIWDVQLHSGSAPTLLGIIIC